MGYSVCLPFHKRERDDKDPSTQIESLTDEDGGVVQEFFLPIERVSHLL